MISTGSCSPQAERTDSTLSGGLRPLVLEHDDTPLLRRSKFDSSKEFERLLAQGSLLERFVIDARRRALPIALFGCGNALKYALGFLQLYDLHPRILIDNDSTLVGSMIGGVTIQSFADAMRQYGDMRVIIVPQDPTAIHAIRDQVSADLPASNIHCFDFTQFMIYRDIQTEASFREFAQKNLDSLKWLYDTLADQESRETLLGYVSGKITSDYEQYARICVEDQYFVPGLVACRDDGVFVDCGAFDGDTVRQFVSRTSGYEAIYAFEADPYNFRLLEACIQRHHYTNVMLFNKATWNHAAQITFNPAEGQLCGACKQGTVTVQAVALDEVLDGRVTHIKMDIEGAEYESLQGARRVIAAHRPLLTVAVYHKYEDVTRIPQLIRDIVPEYRLYLRHHKPWGAELVLYALPA